MSTKVELLHVVGSRPQFPKLAAVMRAVKAVNAHGPTIEESVVHTGQHYDSKMSDIFFAELGIRPPDFNLGIGSGSNSAQTAAALERLAEVIAEVRPEVVVVYGDTNATLAGAIAATQVHVRVAHIEAGVRTGDLFQAEELNRVIVDRIAHQRFCCTRHNLATLAGEGLAADSTWTGDTMLDNYRHFLAQADDGIVARLGLEGGGYLLCTLHRAENTDDPARLAAILDALIEIQSSLWPIVLPLHPRTRKEIVRSGRLGELEAAGVRCIEPLGFLAVQALLEHARLVLSDSGGLQREAYFAGRRCVVPWEFASWPELVEAGWVSIGSIEPAVLVARVAAAAAPTQPEREGLFGAGDAGVQIVAHLVEAVAAR